MGCMNSNDNATQTKEMLQATNQMNDDTSQYHKNESIKTKIILLGAGESGKSTLLKQMRRLHGEPYSEAELYDHKPFLTQNVIESMRTLACYSDLLGDTGKKTVVSTENRAIRDRVAAMSIGSAFTEEVYTDFATLYADAGIQATLELRHEFQLIDTTEYLFANMHKYFHEDYIPTFTDIIHCRTRTIGLTKLKFALKDVNGQISEIYEIFDVGGQKNERRKWLHFFDNAQAIIFVVALSAYNQTLWEDGKSNRLKEAIALFRNIVNLESFVDSSVILFLNKSDIFDTKVGKYPLKNYFKEYQGRETREEVIDFVQSKFRRQMKMKTGSDEAVKRSIHFHVTCATDSDCIRDMFETVREIVLDKELHADGLL